MPRGDGTHGAIAAKWLKIAQDMGYESEQAMYRGELTGEQAITVVDLAAQIEVSPETIRDRARACGVTDFVLGEMPRYEAAKKAVPVFHQDPTKTNHKWSKEAFVNPHHRPCGPKVIVITV